MRKPTVLDCLRHRPAWWSLALVCYLLTGAPPLPGQTPQGAGPAQPAPPLVRPPESMLLEPPPSWNGTSVQSGQSTRVQPSLPPGRQSLVEQMYPLAPVEVLPAPLPNIPNPGMCGPGLGALPGAARTGPRPSAETQREYQQFVKQIIDPQTTFDIVVNRSRVMVLSDLPTRIQIGDDKIVRHDVVSQTELSLEGRAVGITVLNLWFKDPADTKKERVLSYLVRVLPDLEATEHARERQRESQQRYYKQLEAEINHAFPNSLICLSLVGQKLLVSGQTKDFLESQRIMDVIQSNAPRPRTIGGQASGAQTTHTQVATDVQGLIGTRAEAVQQTVPGAAPGGPPEELVEAPRDELGVTIVNQLIVPGEQQVMLKVVVAEVNRSAARSIGINFSVLNSAGQRVFSQLTGSLLNTGTGAGTNANSAGGTGAAGGSSGFGASGVNLPLLLDNGRIPVAINALRTLNLARSLAEPDLVTLNGRPANFQAGGQFPVPIVTGFTAAGLTGVQFVPFGVQLSFLPVITDKDRIRLTIQANVSTRDLATTATVSGTVVPGLNTRNFSTQVEMRKGETLAVAGLIQNNLGGQSERVPFFGDLPLIGRLFSVNSTSASDQELVILVTPELVHPSEPGQSLPLPGSDLVEPDDVEFYLLGRMESRNQEDFRSPFRTDFARQARFYGVGPVGCRPPFCGDPAKTKRYTFCEDILISGPHGHVGDVHGPTGPPH